jgi:NAD-dependent deacetylase
MTEILDNALTAAVMGAIRGPGRITVLTGAGVSAESGIPTFRGPEGFWTVGSTEYRPEEMATREMFCKDPDEVWRWYLYRLGICRSAAPNPGHLALAAMERLLPDRYTLITQNVDGLHLRAGSAPATTYQIHGNIEYMRCAADCTADVYPLPGAVKTKARNEPLRQQDRALLRCPTCKGPARPHVLWFDEAYNEVFYRFRSALEAALHTDLLIVAGTSGATNLPNQVAWTVKERGGLIIDINIDDNPFSRLARASGGFCIRQPSATALPALAEWVARAYTPTGR